MIIDLITGETLEDNTDYNPSLEAYNSFVQLVLNGEKSTKFDKIISDLTFDNLESLGDSRSNSYWWRARSHKSLSEAPYVQQQIGVNRKAPVNGRFNNEGKGLLYLCKKRDTAFEEIHAHIGDVISVGRFKINDLIRVFVFDPDRGFISNTSGVYGDLDAFSARYFLILLLYNYISAENTSNTYIVTQYISSLLENNGVSGILYKSVVDRRNDCLCLFSEEHTRYCYTRQWKLLDYEAANHRYECELLCEAK